MSHVRYSLESNLWAVAGKGAGTKVSRVVNVYWNADDRKWNVNDWNRDDNRWNAGNRVFSPENNGFLPGVLSSGSFLLEALLPAANLTAHLLDALRECAVSFVVQDTELPGNAEQELQRIDAHQRPADRRRLFLFRLIGGNREQLKHVQESGIDLVAERIPRLLRKVVTVSVPLFVRSEQALDDGKRFVLDHVYDHIISVKNLLAAWREFVRGKRKKEDVILFQSRLMDNILALREDLRKGTYRHGSYEAFKISDPKPRDIHKATVRDRLLHHAIYRVLYPHVDRTFIADSYSCRYGKGTHKAMERFRSFAFKVSKNHTRTCHVLKCDIKKFFASIHHETMFGILEKYTRDERLLSLIREVVGSFHTKTPGVGLPLGNLTSQLLVNVYMNEFDQFAKHRLRARYYIRYADDFVFLSRDREWLQGLLPRISGFLETRLRLSLHPDKIHIRTFSSGVDFLGWVHFPDHRVLRPASRRRMFRKLAEGKTQERVQSYLGLLSHGNAEKLKRSLL